MSEENVEMVRGAFGASNRRDLDALLAFMDPDVELKARSMEVEGDASCF
jgi:ketosteroid isomerase-like protein